MQKTVSVRNAQAYKATTLNKLMQAVVKQAVAAQLANSKFSFYVRFNAKSKTYYAYCITTAQQAVKQRAKRNSIVQHV